MSQMTDRLDTCPQCGSDDRKIQLDIRPDCECHHSWHDVPQPAQRRKILDDLVQAEVREGLYDRLPAQAGDDEDSEVHETAEQSRLSTVNHSSKRRSGSAG